MNDWNVSIDHRHSATGLETYESQVASLCIICDRSRWKWSCLMRQAFSNAATLLSSTQTAKHTQHSHVREFILKIQYPTSTETNHTVFYGSLSVCIFSLKFFVSVSASTNIRNAVFSCSSLHNFLFIFAI